MLQIAEQTAIRKWHRWLFGAQLQLSNYILCVCSTNEVKPFLHIFFMNEIIIFSSEEFVKVKFLEFTLGSHFTYAIWKLVCHHYHLRQLSIRIIRALPLFFFTLLIRICPVINLFLYEFPC